MSTNEPRPHRPPHAEDREHRQSDAVTADTATPQTVARTPKPKVLARLPRVDRATAATARQSESDVVSATAVETSERRSSGASDQAACDPSSPDAAARSATACKSSSDPKADPPRKQRPASSLSDRLPGFDGRIINQRLATRILIGGAVALLLIAIVPLAFRGGDEEDGGEVADAPPAWQPENPAPDAPDAPAWPAAEATPGQPGSYADATPSIAPFSNQGEQVTRGPQAPRSVSAPPDWPAPTSIDESANQAVTPPWSQNGGAGQADRDFRNTPANRALTNQGQSLPSADLPSEMTAGNDGYGTAPNRETTPMPDAHSPADRYEGRYQAAQPYPAYRQARRPDRSVGESASPGPRYGQAASDSSVDQWSTAPTDTASGHYPAPDYSSEEFTPIDSPSTASPQPASYSAPNDYRSSYDRGPSRQDSMYGGALGAGTTQQGAPYQSSPYDTAPYQDTPYQNRSTGDTSYGAEPSRTAPYQEGRYREAQYPEGGYRANGYQEPADPASSYQPSSRASEPSGAGQAWPATQPSYGQPAPSGYERSSSASPSNSYDDRYGSRAPVNHAPAAHDGYAPATARFEGGIQQPVINAQYESGSRATY